jgi:hypothetical protein
MILMKKISDGGKTVHVVFICISVQKPVAEIGVGGRSYAPPPVFTN